MEFTLDDTDSVIRDLLEIEVKNSDTIAEDKIDLSTAVADESAWRSWTGRRWRNGEEYHGPIYLRGSNIEYTGPRSCACKACEATVLPIYRYN